LASGEPTIRWVTSIGEDLAMAPLIGFMMSEFLYTRDKQLEWVIGKFN